MKALAGDHSERSSKPSEELILNEGTDDGDARGCNSTGGTRLVGHAAGHECQWTEPGDRELPVMMDCGSEDEMHERNPDQAKTPETTGVPAEQQEGSLQHDLDEARNEEDASGRPLLDNAYSQLEMPVEGATPPCGRRRPHAPNGQV